MHLTCKVFYIDPDLAFLYLRPKCCTCLSRAEATPHANMYDSFPSSAVKRGDRIAQLVLERILTPPVEEVEVILLHGLQWACSLTAILNLGDCSSQLVYCGPVYVIISQADFVFMHKSLDMV